MTTPLRISPLHDSLEQFKGSWREINRMPSLVTHVNESANAELLGIADLSCLTRFGVKGAGAAGWLEQSIPVPDRPNTWCPLPEGGMVARLGRTEFLIEDSLHSTLAPRLAKACQQPPGSVYSVLRQDAAIALCGAAVNELLLQTCNFNFRAVSLVERPVVLTMIVGVSAIVIPDQRNGQPFYRIWCDGTFGAYVWSTLLAIAQELGGGAVGAGLFL